MSEDLLKTIKGFKKYKTESILIISSIIVTLISLFIFITSSSKSTNEIYIDEKIDESKVKEKEDFKDEITVDVSGAVIKPGVYSLKNGSRINDAIDRASGLSYDADAYYFYRNFNLSALIYDQEKIYVPYLWEITSGIFVENPRILNYLSAIPLIKDAIIDKSQEKTNINSASIDELDELPGIGAVTAQKIIQNRPYSNIEDLQTKKIVSKTVFENIKDQITAN